MRVLPLRTKPPLTSPRLLLHPLLLLVLLPCVSSNTLVTVRLNRYYNTDNRMDRDDRFCNEDASPCNIEFIVRLMAPVSYAIKLAAREVTEITFSDTITDYEGIEKPNPFPGTEEEQTVTVGIPSVAFVLHLWHVQADGDVKRVARLSHQRWFDTWGPETVNVTDELGHSSIDLTTTLECAPDFYPRPIEEQSTDVSNCTYCKETEQYTCNQENGSRICKEGWQGANCDIVIPENCPAIEEANSTISPTTYKTDSLNVGYTLTFSCPGPYLSYLSSSPFMTCLESGEWNSTVPSCIPVVENIDQKMSSLRNTGLFILAGIVVTFGSAVTIMTYTINYMGRLSSEQLLKTDVISKQTNISPSQPQDGEGEKSDYAEEDFPPDYTDKTHLVTERVEIEVVKSGSSQQIKVNLDTSDLGVEDVDF
ncbi:hypothetical protein ACHWQZ_G005207 [Mnemiopsis leidyi]